MKILVLDSNNSILEMTKEYLSYLGVEEIYLYKNTSNLTKVGLEAFDIVIVDINQTAIILREPNLKDSLDTSKTLIMANDMNDPYIKHCFEMGFHNYIHKPFGMYNFMSAVTLAILVKTNSDEIVELKTDLKGKEALASVGEVAGKIAHEINNPITCVGTNIEALKDYVTNLKIIIENYRNFKELCRKHTQVEAFVNRIQKLDLLEKEHKIDHIIKDLDILLEDTHSGTQRVCNIVKNIKTFIRQSADTDKTLNSVNEIMIEAIKTVKRVNINDVSNGIEFNIELQDVQEIECNSLLIYQVFVNILSNSVQALQGMSEKIDGQIIVKSYLEDNYVVCSVEDNGPGIPENVKKRIFEPFFTTKAVGLGTGLGLSISKDIIVKKHSGEINVQSELGQGTLFVIKLPRIISKKI